MWRFREKTTGLAMVELGNDCHISFKPARGRTGSGWILAGVLALVSSILSPPLHAQTRNGVVAMIPAAQAGIPSHGDRDAVAPPNGFCDPSLPECVAKRALAEGLARRDQEIAQNQPAPHAPDAAPPAAAPPAAAAPLTGAAYGGLAAAAAAAAAAKAEENTIRFGLIAPFSGANKDFAGELKLGAEAAFDAANESGGINGKTLRLIVADDGYDPARTPDLAKSLAEKDKVFGFISNFGTATSTAILPYVLEHKLIFFGAFSGGGALRNQPPDRYVFNYRPSYAEETEAVVRYLVKVRRLKPDQIAVFAQDDAFGDAGYAGVEKALRAFDENAGASVLHMRYARNSIDVAAAMDDLRKHHNLQTTSVTRVRERVASAKTDGDARPQYRERVVRQVKTDPGVKAVVMVATYRAAAKFIEKARERYPDLIFTNVSAVGSNNFAEELKLLGPRFPDGIIVTQVVPDPDGYSTLALEYKAALAKFFPAEHADYVSFESYINAKIMLEGLKRAGPQPDSDKLVNALENIHNLDLGLGATVNFGASEHQAIHKVWGTQLDDQGRYHVIDLE